MGNAYSTVAGGFTNVTVHFPTLAGGLGGLFVCVCVVPEEEQKGPWNATSSGKNSVSQ